MSIITSGLLPKLTRPGLHAVVGLKYAEIPQQWMPIYEMAESDKNYEEEVMLSTMGYARSLASGEAVSYDDMKQAWTARYTHNKIGLGMIVTEEEIEDNLYLSVGEMRAACLGRSMAETKNFLGASVLSLGFTTSLGGDGVTLFSANHPAEAGNQSNILTVAADLSESSLEEMLVNIYSAKDPRGEKRVLLREQALVIPHQLEFEACRILKGTERPGTADRDINAMNYLNKFPKGVVVNRYLTSSKAWFITTDCPNGLKYMERRALRFDSDNEFTTSNMCFKATERYIFNFTDWRTCYGSPGA